MLTRFCAANWRVSHLSVSGVGRSRATRARPTQTVVFAFARARARRAVSRSRAPRVASRPARRLSTSAAHARDGERSSRADGPLRRVRDGGRGAEARHVVGHGEPRRRRVRRGAGDVHSEYVVDSRSRVRVRVGSPPHRPLGRIRFFVVSSISARRARSRLRRTSEPRPRRPRRRSNTLDH